MRIVLDANIYVGAVLSPGAVCDKVISLFTDLDSPFELIVTEKIIAEVLSVLLRPRLMNLLKKTESEINVVMQDFANLGTFVPGGLGSYRAAKSL